MEFFYDNFGRISKVNFDDHDDQKAFWDNWSKTIVCMQQETTLRNRDVIDAQMKMSFLLGSKTEELPPNTDITN